MSPPSFTAQINAWRRRLGRFFHEGYRPVALVFYNREDPLPFSVDFNLRVVTGFSGMPDTPLPHPQQAADMVAKRLRLATQTGETPLAIMLAATHHPDLMICYCPPGLREGRVEKTEVERAAKRAYRDFTQQVHEAFDEMLLSECTPGTVH